MLAADSISSNSKRSRRGITIPIVSLFLTSALSLSGCVQKAPNLQTRMSNAALFDNLVPSTAEKTAFISVKNMTDVPLLTNESLLLLTQHLTEKKYQIVPNS